MSLSDSEVAQHLHEILEQPEFRQPNRDVFTRWITDGFEALVRWLGGLDSWVRIAIIVACVVSLAAIIGHIWWTLRQLLIPRQPLEARQQRGTPLAEPDSFEQLHQQALRWATEGHYRAAARTLQKALWVKVCKLAGRAWRPELTDWEWVGEFSNRPSLAAFTRCAQQIVYGSNNEGMPNEPRAADFERCLKLFEEATEGSPIAVQLSG